jgi:outer membrane protein assembly factor BamB
VQGLALGDGVVFATTADVRNVNGKEASLFALDPSDGAVIDRFDPGDDTPGSATGPLVDAVGMVYFGVRGRHDLLAAPYDGQWRRGTMFGVAWNAGERRFEERWRMEVDALLDWATPALDADGVLYFGSTAPLPTRGLADIWEPFEGTPPRTTPLLFAIAR